MVHWTLNSLARYLNDLTAQCASKSNDFAARQQLRAEELEAITKAVEILASGSVTGMSEKHLPQLVQTSFALRASTTLTPVQRNVAAFLQDRAAKLQSRVLSMVAAKVTEDPFVKVRGWERTRGNRKVTQSLMGSFAVGLERFPKRELRFYALGFRAVI